LLVEVEVVAIMAEAVVPVDIEPPQELAVAGHLLNRN
jgi:hypothetical protein